MLPKWVVISVLATGENQWDSIYLEFADQIEKAKEIVGKAHAEGRHCAVREYSDALAPVLFSSWRNTRKADEVKA